MSFWEKLTGKKPASNQDSKDNPPSVSDGDNFEEKPVDSSSVRENISVEQQKAMEEILKPPQQ